MGEHRRWQEVKVWKPDAFDRLRKVWEEVPDDEAIISGPVGDLRSDAEVLAEMGGERVYRHSYEDGISFDFDLAHFCNKDCGWVWIVKEAAE